MSHLDGGRDLPPGPVPCRRDRGDTPPAGAYYVYILCGPSRRLQVGVTNDLVRRMLEHRGGGPAPNGSCLVYFEVISDLRRALAREEQFKCWNRQRMARLIEALNPAWRDLAVDGQRPAVNEEM